MAQLPEISVLLLPPQLRRQIPEKLLRPKLQLAGIGQEHPDLIRGRHSSRRGSLVDPSFLRSQTQKPADRGTSVAFRAPGEFLPVQSAFQVNPHPLHPPSHIGHRAEARLAGDPVDQRLGRAGDQKREIRFGDPRHADRIHGLRHGEALAST